MGPRIISTILARVVFVTVHTHTHVSLTESNAKTRALTPLPYARQVLVTKPKKYLKGKEKRMTKVICRESGS